MPSVKFNTAIMLPPHNKEIYWFNFVRLSVPVCLLYVRRPVLMSICQSGYCRSILLKSIIRFLPNYRCLWCVEVLMSTIVSTTTLVLVGWVTPNDNSGDQWHVILCMPWGCSASPKIAEWRHQCVYCFSINVSQWTIFYKKYSIKLTVSPLTINIFLASLKCYQLSTVLC